MKKRFLVVLHNTPEEEEKGGWWYRIRAPYKLYRTIDKAIAGGKKKIQKEKQERTYGYTTFSIYYLNDQTDIFELCFSNVSQLDQRKERQ